MLLLTFFLVICICDCGDPKKIDKLPLFSGPPLNIEQWVGYIDVPFKNPKTTESYDHHLFYYLVKNTVLPNPPLLIWLNGGPGCSGFDGLLREIGPFGVTSSPDGTLKVEKRSSSWSEFAHVLYIDSPVSTGFSYSDNRDDYNDLGDALTSQDLLAFLFGFFQKFPELKTNRLFITGESYGGHFVPQLTNLIDQYNQQQYPTKYFNLQGYLLVNGLTDYQYMIDTLPKFLTNHFLVPKSDYDVAYAECKGDFYHYFYTKNCSAALTKVTSILYNGILNPLDIYSDCEVNGVGPSHPLPCTDYSPQEEYLSRPDVLATLGVDLKNTLLQNRFEMCVSLFPSFGYSKVDSGVSQIPIHLNLTKKYPFLFFSGDADSIVNNLASEVIMDVMFGPTAEVKHDVWYYDTVNSKGVKVKQMGGTSKVFGNINFFTVKGGGHQVPVTKLYQTYDIVKDFVCD